eukprot:Gb_35617 [translate_table: standard]
MHPWQKLATSRPPPPTPSPAWPSPPAPLSRREHHLESMLASSLHGIRSPKMIVALNRPSLVVEHSAVQKLAQHEHEVDLYPPIEFASLKTEVNLSYSSFLPTSCPKKIDPSPTVAAICVPSMLQAMLKSEQATIFPFEYAHPILSQISKELKLPTTKDSPEDTMQLM